METKPEVGPAVSPGHVYLVGAGPGAVGLLTLRALEVLSSCDIVLHDRLVPPKIVSLARRDAEVRSVAKDAGVSSADMKVQQDDISQQLVEAAKRGLAVCRLKGGDPLIYGRAGEEMEILAAAQVPFEVVPAVTAALSAAADSRIPLTFRGIAASLHVHTMNSSTIKDPSFDWTQFEAPGATFALYMGLTSLPGVCGQLLGAGVPACRPMAVIDRASLPEVRVVAGTVATLPKLVEEVRSELAGPALVLLGQSVALRERLGADAFVPQPESSEPALAAALALVPTLSDDALRQLQDATAKLLASRQEGVAALSSDPARSLKRSIEHQE